MRTHVPPPPPEHAFLAAGPTVGQPRPLNCPVTIRATGRFAPPNIVHSTALDARLGLAPGTLEALAKVKTRRYASERETSTYMAAQAARDALTRADMTPSDLDCIVSVSGVNQQPIPSNAALIQEHLGLSRLPSFDVNATCLSYIVGLDLIAPHVASGRYTSVLLVASDKASTGINDNQHESAALFGDGAAATILTRSTDATEHTGSRLIAARLETYPEGAHWTEIRGGGNQRPASRYTLADDADFKFDMDGRKVFRLAYERIDGFLDSLFAAVGTTFRDALPSIAAVVPHQSSPRSLRILQRKLGIPDEKFVNVTEEYGNMVAASLPFALDHAIRSRTIERGQTILLMGAGAGMSFGGMLLEY